MREEAKRTEPIIKRHDDGALLRETCAVVSFLRAKAGVVAAAIDPHHDRPFCIRVEASRPHIEIQAVFGNTGGKRIDVAVDLRLHAVLAKSVCRARAAPTRDWGWRAPAQIPNRRSRVWNAA